MDLHQATLERLVPNHHMLCVVMVGADKLDGYLHPQEAGMTDVPQYSQLTRVSTYLGGLAEIWILIP